MNLDNFYDENMIGTYYIFFVTITSLLSLFQKYYFAVFVARNINAPNVPSYK